MENKTCPRCGETKPIRGNFGVLQSGPRAGRVYGYCNECRREYARAAKRRKRGVPEDLPTDEFRRLYAKPVGHTYTHKGYVLEKAGVGAHHRADRYGYVPQHVLALERHLGVEITTAHTVHHRNGDRADNRPENLELRLGPHGKGADILPGLLRDPEARRLARQILAAYEEAP